MSYEVTFADNTEVTLENMDNIAKDLGDTEFSEFSTNKFGVNTLNLITSDLVSAGILRTEENANMGCEPIIDGTNVIIGTGAKIIGRVTIGKNSKIGPNVVIREDVEENSIIKE